MFEDKEDEEIFTKLTGDIVVDDNIKLKYTKKGLIFVGISILIILVAVALIIYFIFKTHEDEQNYILAKFSVNKNAYHILFHRSYYGLVKTMKVNNKEVNINNNVTFNEKGIIEVKLIFKEKLKNLDNLFYHCHSLEEVDLSFLFSLQNFKKYNF